MIATSIWIRNIKVGIKDLAYPVGSFKNYEFSQLYTMYSNFLQAIMVYLYDDMRLDDFLHHCQAEEMISAEALDGFKQLDVSLSAFFEKAKELTDFEVIRRPEWGAIAPLAQACLEALESRYTKRPVVVKTRKSSMAVNSRRSACLTH